jgi:hypothetical protein
MSPEVIDAGAAVRCWRNDGWRTVRVLRRCPAVRGFSAAPDGPFSGLIEIMHRTNDIEPLLPPDATEQALGLPEGTLSPRRLKQPGAPPYYQLSRKRILLKPSDVRRWLNEHERRGSERAYA